MPDQDADRAAIIALIHRNRIAIWTTNRGNANNNLLVAGTANTPLNFRPLDGSAIPGGGSVGFGRSEPAFIQSDDGPFTIEVVKGMASDQNQLVRKLVRD